MHTTHNAEETGAPSVDHVGCAGVERQATAELDLDLDDGFPPQRRRDLVGLSAPNPLGATNATTRKKTSLAVSKKYTKKM